jgi:hypothetical protein
MTGTPGAAPVYWSADDPERLEADVADVAAFAPDLVFVAPGELNEIAAQHDGLWYGVLPIWPFDRVAPEGLERLVPRGLKCVVICSPVHPVLPPDVIPVDPKPLALEHSMHVWHVAPYGNLCLMQSYGAWDPKEKVSQLLLKACGWHIEYALMKSDAISAMTLNGIANDPSLDETISAVAARLPDDAEWDERDEVVVD